MNDEETQNVDEVIHEEVETPLDEIPQSEVVETPLDEDENIVATPREEASRDENLILDTNLDNLDILPEFTAFPD